MPHTKEVLTKQNSLEQQILITKFYVNVEGHIYDRWSFDMALTKDWATIQ